MKKPSKPKQGKAALLQAARDRLERLRKAAKAARNRERQAKARLKEAHKAAKRAKKAAKAAKADLKAALKKLDRHRKAGNSSSRKPARTAKAKPRQLPKRRRKASAVATPFVAPPGDEAQITPSAASVDIAPGGADSSSPSTP